MGNTNTVESIQFKAPTNPSTLDTLVFIRDSLVDSDMTKIQYMKKNIRGIFNEGYKFAIDFCLDDWCKDDIIPDGAGYDDITEALKILNTTYKESTNIQCFGSRSLNKLTINSLKMESVIKRNKDNYKLTRDLLISYVSILACIIIAAIARCCYII